MKYFSLNIDGKAGDLELGKVHQRYETQASEKLFKKKKERKKLIQLMSEKELVFVDDSII